MFFDRFVLVAVVREQIGRLNGSTRWWMDRHRTKRSAWVGCGDSEAVNTRLGNLRRKTMEGL
jgi:hypothetical protein